MSQGEEGENDYPQNLELVGVIGFNGKCFLEPKQLHILPLCCSLCLF
jgi:hypothetical protein